MLLTNGHGSKQPPVQQAFRPNGRLYLSSASVFVWSPGNYEQYRTGRCVNSYFSPAFGFLNQRVMDDATWKLAGSSAEVLATPSAGGRHSFADHELERRDEWAAGRRDSADVPISARPEKSGANDQPGARRAQRCCSCVGFGF